MHPVRLVIGEITILWHSNCIGREVTLCHHLVGSQLGGQDYFFVHATSPVDPDEAGIPMNRAPPLVGCVTITPETEAKSLASLCLSTRYVAWIRWLTLGGVACMTSTLFVTGRVAGKIPKVVGGFTNPVSVMHFVPGIAVALRDTVEG